MKSDNQYLVLAANHKQFDYYAKRYGWYKDIENYVYASSMQAIRGKRYKDILKVGEWWLNEVYQNYPFLESMVLE